MKCRSLCRKLFCPTILIVIHLCSSMKLTCHLPLSLQYQQQHDDDFHNHDNDNESDNSGCGSDDDDGHEGGDGDNNDERAKQTCTTLSHMMLKLGNVFILCMYLITQTL